MGWLEDEAKKYGNDDRDSADWWKGGSIKVQSDWYKLNDGLWHHVVCDKGKTYFDGLEILRLENAGCFARIRNWIGSIICTDGGIRYIKRQKGK